MAALALSSGPRHNHQHFPRRRNCATARRKHTRGKNPARAKPRMESQYGSLGLLPVVWDGAPIILFQKRAFFYMQFHLHIN